VVVVGLLTVVEVDALLLLDLVEEVVEEEVVAVPSLEVAVVDSSLVAVVVVAGAAMQDGIRIHSKVVLLLVMHITNNTIRLLLCREMEKRGPQRIPSRKSIVSN
jgi:hypothetical protein